MSSGSLCEGDKHFRSGAVGVRLPGDATLAEFKATYYDDKFGGQVTKLLCESCLSSARHLIDTMSAMPGEVKKL